jgi:hypothetical protein
MALEVRWYLVIVSLLLVAVVGCGGPGLYSGALYPTTGQVLLADGHPLTGGSVRFIPKRSGLPATGKIAADGTFSLTTKTREGAAPGEYKVRIEPSPEMVSKKGRASKKLPFAARYRNYEGDTGLTATVEAGPTRLEPFRLDAK